MADIIDIGAAPVARQIDWAGLRKGLFGSPANIAITVGFALILAFVVVPVLRWATWNATFVGTAQDCRAGEGACWAFLTEKIQFMVFGLYPMELDWQAGAATIVILVATIAAALPRFWHSRFVAAWVVAIAVALLLFSGTGTGHPVSTQKWGGFPLTLLLAVVGFAAAFPVGIALALGRRSRLLVVRLLSTAVIEVMRGVPLIAVLYVSTLLFPLLLPAGASVDKLLRAQVAIIIFVAAYMAEIVRAGLQALPAGQEEAARALGLGWWQTTRLVVLPQALRAVVPAFVTLGIGIFLDTTLVIVIGLFDFLNTAKLAAADPNWLGFYNEAFAFAAAVYFIFCFAASRYSSWLEKRVGGR